MKCVLASIKPKWCMKVESREKKAEVRKTAPLLPTPFKVYIYCTQGVGADTFNCPVSFETIRDDYMSSMDNHRRRSRRGNRMKQAAFGSMARRPYITLARFKNTTFGLKDLFKLMRAANHGRKSRAVQPQAESAAEE